jgi:hypothetical protein
LSYEHDMSGSFLDDTCVGRLVAVFWPSHVRWYEGEVRRRRRNRSNLKRKLSFLSAAKTHHRLEPAAIKASLGRRERIRINESIPLVLLCLLVQVTAFNKKSRQHLVLYTDGRQEWSNLVECGRFLSDNAAGDAVVSSTILFYVIWSDLISSYSMSSYLR